MVADCAALCVVGYGVYAGKSYDIFLSKTSYLLDFAMKRRGDGLDGSMIIKGEELARRVLSICLQLTEIS